MNLNSEYRPQTAAETVQLIANDVDPWLAFGQFLDDWRRCDLAQRPALVDEQPPEGPDIYIKWVALLAGRLALRPGPPVAAPVDQSQRVLSA